MFEEKTINEVKHPKVLSLNAASVIRACAVLYLMHLNK